MDGTRSASGHAVFACLPLICALTLGGCGAEGLLRAAGIDEQHPNGAFFAYQHPRPLHLGRPLAEAQDNHMSAQILAIVVRDGPGSWIDAADWDEYRIALSNVGHAPLSVASVDLIDAVGVSVKARDSARTLGEDTQHVGARYKSAIAQTAEVGVVGVGVAATAAGASLAPSLVFPPLAIAAAGTAVTMGGVRLGVSQLLENEVQRRAARLPIRIEPGTRADLHFFYAITPLPMRAEITYSSVEGERRLAVPLLSQAGVHTTGLHPPPELVRTIQPDYPDEAVMAGIDSGFVKARVHVSSYGRPYRVEIVEAQPSDVFNREAVRILFQQRYTWGDDCVVEETVEFNKVRSPQ